jgi:hypothetical protein
MIEAAPSSNPRSVRVLKDQHSPDKGAVENNEDWTKLQEAFRMR